MSQYCCETAQNLQYTRFFYGLPLEQGSGINRCRQPTLKYIYNDYNQCLLPTQNAKYICSTGITATMFSDIDTLNILPTIILVGIEPVT
jgi:hypothetical protein